MKRALTLLALMSVPTAAMARTPDFTCKIHPGVTDYALKGDSCDHDVTVNTSYEPNSRLQNAETECTAASGRKFVFRIYLTEGIDTAPEDGFPVPSSNISFEVTREGLRPAEQPRSNSSGLGFNWGLPTHFFLNLVDGAGRVYQIDCQD